MKEICPELATKSHPMTCCDTQQILHLETAFKLSAQMGLSVCPSCLANFRKTLCQFACSPRQNQFIRIVNATQFSNNLTIVNHVEYFIDSQYAQGLFDSCKGINNGNVLNMMCGKWGIKSECTPQRWLDFMGLSTQLGGYSPFQMDVKLTNANSLIVNEIKYYPMNESALACNELPKEDDMPCNCEHCREACDQS